MVSPFADLYAYVLDPQERRAAEKRLQKLYDPCPARVEMTREDEKRLSDAMRTLQRSGSRDLDFYNPKGKEW